MPTVSYTSSGAVAIPTGIPSLVTDSIVAAPTGYDLATLSAIMVYINITPPTEGSQMLDVWFGPSGEADTEDLTGLHNSFQGGLSLAGIIYPTDRQVYSWPLTKWLPFVTDPITWTLSIYNWSEVNTGTLNSWWVSYVIGVDTDPIVIPLNPIQRNLGRYYGMGSTVRKDVTFTLKEMSIDGVIGFVMPISFDDANLRSAFYSSRNYDITPVTLSLSLIRDVHGVETTVWSGAVTVPVGFSRGSLGASFGTFAAGDGLYFKVTDTTSTNVDFTIQATLTEE